MVYVKNVIREMFQETYVIRDLNENRLVIRDRDPPPPLYHPVASGFGRLTCLFCFMSVSDFTKLTGLRILNKRVLCLIKHLENTDPAKF